MQKVTTILAAVALIIIGIFAVQNLGPVEVSFLVWSQSVSKIVVILGTYVLGMLTGWGLVELIKAYFKKG